MSTGAGERRVVLGLEHTPSGPARFEGEEGLRNRALTYRGDALDPTTGRRFFLDAPSDLRPGEPVTVVLSLHGGGGLGNWQRHYFPLVDLKERLRLVVVTPTAATMVPFVPDGPKVRVWTPDADDEHLRSVVALVIDALGPSAVRVLWLAGHSQGGMTAARLLHDPFFAERVDGLVSLSGGRIGGIEMVDRFGPPQPDGSPPEPRAVLPPGDPPHAEVSYIYTTGEREVVRLPDTSPWADRLGGGPRRRLPDIVDDEPGHIWDFGRCTYPVWGLRAAPGRAEVHEYPGARDGRVIADVVRLGKGHTEGLEPKVTAAIAGLMVSAPGGRVAARA